MIILFFLLPLLFYVFFYFIFRSNSKYNFIISSIVAFISLLATVVTIYNAPQWASGERVVWTGIRVKDSKEAVQKLIIGGSVETASVGWATGAFAPRVEATLEGNKTKLTISDGSGFIKNEKGDFLNGEVIEPDTVQKFGIYTFSQKKSFWSGEFLTISLDDKTLVELKLPSGSSKVYNLMRLVERPIANDEKSKDNSQTPSNIERFKNLEELKYWAQNIRLMSGGGIPPRILTMESRSENIACENPCSFTVMWAGNSQLSAQFIKEDKGNIALQYLSPLRNLSSVPPTEANNQLSIVEQPQIDEFAFTLPLAGNEQKTINKNRPKIDVLPLHTSNEKEDPVIIKKKESDCKFLPPGVNDVLTCTSVEGENLGYVMATIRDLPNFYMIVALILMALVIFTAGLWLALPEKSLNENWHKQFGLIAGIITIIWNILLIRLLLAFRYALDPIYLDSFTVNGLVLSFIALIVVPGFLLLSVRLQFDVRNIDVKKRKYSLIYLAGLILFSLIAFWFSTNLWTNLPARFLPSKFYFIISIFALFVIYLYFTWFTYHSTAKQPILLFTKGNFLCQKISEFSRKVFKFPLLKLIVIFTLFSILLFILILFSRLFFSYLGFERIVSQIGIPLIIWLPLILCWLSVKNNFPKDKWKIAFTAILTIGVLFITTYFIRDVGLLYAGGALFIALTVILFLREGFAHTCGLTWLGVWMVLALFAIIGYWQFERVFRYLPGESASRILAYKEGDDFQSFLLVADVGSKGNDLKLNTNKVQNIFFHLSEMESIVHKGGLFGLGYGRAPARQSSIGQNTIQADSVYSFFIVGDYGSVGGLALLLIFTLPCVLILIDRYENFEIGSAFAFILFVSFLIEALTHAAMNLQVIPFTGRNLPLLSVGSFNSDVFRWTIIFFISIFALFWRYDKRGEFNKDSIPIFEKPLLNPSAIDKNTKTLTALWSRIKNVNLFLLNEFKLLIPIRRIIVLGLIPCLILISTIYRHGIIFYDSDAETIRLDKIEDTIDYFIDHQYITVGGESRDPECPQLGFDKAKLEEDGIGLVGVSDMGKTFIQNQIDTFNAIPCENNRLESNSVPVANELKLVKDINSFNNDILGNKLRFQVKPAQRFSRPNLFAVTRFVSEKNDDNPDQDKTGFLVAFNPSFYYEKHFETELEKNQIPTIGYESGEKLIGQAWVKGKWVSSFSDDSTSLSWRDGMQAYLQSEWEQLGPDSAKIKYQALTLNKQLNTAALEFIDSKGHNLFEKTLKASSDKIVEKLPLRVGLTVMRLSNGTDNGAILALAGYPRSVSGDKWQTNKLGDLIPPATQVENVFSPDLRTRYAGDRNFDIGVVMGSSTKPIWAAAVLERHSTIELNQKFKVSGIGKSDSSVFGIPVAGKPWEVHSKENLVDFNKFLSQSNNRYQILLGFLGLANSNDNEISVVESKNSLSNLEQMNGNIWGKYPVFPVEIKFSESKPNELINLQSTSLAKDLNQMFGIITVEEKRKGFKPYLNSFWTKNENDDIYGKSSKSSRRLPISSLPIRTNFRLNKIKTPREYISWLLGGGENKWSNVHIAAAFASCVTGKPTLPHIVKNDVVAIFSPERMNDFKPVAEVLRPALAETVRAGTATKWLSSSKIFLEKLKNNGYRSYAKTGTLNTDENGKSTARLLLVIAKTNETGDIIDGLAFSIYGERAGQGVPATWLSEFLVSNQKLIGDLLHL